MPINPASLKAALAGDMENAMIAATPGGIERQEKAGQAALVNSTAMPLKMRPSREAFEKIGFRFGAPIDEIFIDAQLPVAWSRQATDHSMHSDILDAEGRIRVAVFYKAAFYDRRANARLIPRFRVETLYGDVGDDSGRGKDESAVIVTDAGREIYRSPTIKSAAWTDVEAAQRTAQEWLLSRYPNANDPTAYW